MSRVCRGQTPHVPVRSLRRQHSGTKYLHRQRDARIGESVLCGQTCLARQPQEVDFHRRIHQVGRIPMNKVRVTATLGYVRHHECLQDA